MPTPAAIKGRLADQTMHPRLGSQPAKGVLSFELDCGTLQSRYFTCGCFDQSRLEPLILAPPQIHAEQHLGPVLRFSATGSGLDIEIGVVLIGLAREHATEFELFEYGLEAHKVLFYRTGGFLVVFLDGKLQ